ncbi:hypothetical protein CLOSTMETH_01410 [[Clostridium] methylpentosum DSM 5476]|uniref:Uncharacterized protein n=1 Tax=[Clostridium] methylpentosum DSM 5476 TaxID=537013 RepID=C0EC41_9FIRM|nr:hypothetical protein CLOSTMETH_01410 [[Clostridium] methylpentosum DSM 5476]
MRLVSFQNISVAEHKKIWFKWTKRQKPIGFCLFLFAKINSLNKQKFYLIL